jgi:hypothetical protein
MTEEPYIEVKIPCWPGNLGHAYNLAMEGVKGWVLFIDSDVYLRTQRLWYDICQDAIRQKGMGLYTCGTNRIGCGPQRCIHAPKGDDIAEHMKFADARYKEYRNLVDPIPFVKPSGFFMLFHRKMWDTVKFTAGFLGVDNRFALDIKAAGFPAYIIQGLYLYHGYSRDWRLPPK